MFCRAFVGNLTIHFSPLCRAVIAFLCSPRTNLAHMLSFLFGRASSLTVLYNLNLRGTLANSSRGTSETDATTHADTVIEPGQLFGRMIDIQASGLPSRCSNNSHKEDVRWIGARRAAIVPATIRSQDGRDCDSKPITDVCITATNRNSHTGAVRVSLTNGASLYLNTPLSCTQSAELMTSKVRPELLLPEPWPPARTPN